MIKKTNRYLKLILSLFISAILFNLLIKQLNVITGGVNGIALILYNLFRIDEVITISFLLFLLLLLSYIFLGIDNVKGSVLSTIIYPFFVKITSNLYGRVVFAEKYYIIVSIIIGIISGISNVLMYQTEFSNGGLPIINQILYKYRNISIGISSFIINGIIVLIGGILFGMEKIIYSVIILLINSIIIFFLLKRTSIKT